VSLSGKGTIIGGQLFHNTSVSHKTCGCQYTIDGVAMNAWTFYDLSFNNMIYPTGMLFQIRVYNDSDYSYILGYTWGITFEASLVLTLNEAVGASTFGGRLYYSLVT